MNDDWTGWRGSRRDGRVKWLPARLPEKPEFAWTAELAGKGIGGIAVAQGKVIVAGRDRLDSFDVIQCIGAESGEELWKHQYEAKGSLDYGNSPRATPLVYQDYVITLGAFGHLCCIELESGIPLWQRNISTDFKTPEMTWGHSGSPLLVDEKLILQPGGSEGSLVALDVETGETIWSVSGEPASYSSFVHMSVGGKSQLLGFDAVSLGGWDPADGKRLWKHVPAKRGDFNVPTIIPFRDSVGDKIIISTENNGTRILAFDSDGKIESEPLAHHARLAPDTHTPVLVGDRVFGIWNSLFSLKVSDKFKTEQELEHDAFMNYGSIIASDERLLILTLDGELLLVSVEKEKLEIVSHLKLDVEPSSVYSHPAMVGKALFMRLEDRLVRLDLK